MVGQPCLRLIAACAARKVACKGTIHNSFVLGLLYFVRILSGCWSKTLACSCFSVYHAGGRSLRAIFLGVVPVGTPVLPVLCCKTVELTISRIRAKSATVFIWLDHSSSTSQHRSSKDRSVPPCGNLASASFPEVNDNGLMLLDFLRV